VALISTRVADSLAGSDLLAVWRPALLASWWCGPRELTASLQTRRKILRVSRCNPFIVGCPTAPTHCENWSRRSPRLKRMLRENATLCSSLR